MLEGLETVSDTTPRPKAEAPAGGLPVIGKEFGGYRIDRELGRGGMGAVYEAEQLESGRRVALKLLNHQLDSPEARARFLREGRLAASINHPNSVYVYGTE
ncbi:MAG: protein kinase, partial [Planctomycetota bacterium]|nr:protein kinase [Planctomycetota bacterium]